MTDLEERILEMRRNSLKHDTIATTLHVAKAFVIATCDAYLTLEQREAIHAELIEKKRKRQPKAWDANEINHTIGRELRRIWAPAFDYAAEEQ